MLRRQAGWRPRTATREATYLTWSSNQTTLKSAAAAVTYPVSLTSRGRSGSNVKFRMSTRPFWRVSSADAMSRRIIRVNSMKALLRPVESKSGSSGRAGDCGATTSWRTTNTLLDAAARGSIDGLSCRGWRCTQRLAGSSRSQHHTPASVQTAAG